MTFQGIIIFGACAVVVVAAVVIEEWPNIKETYIAVRNRRRQRHRGLLVRAHQRHSHVPEEDQLSLAASGIHDPPPQEMAMRSRTQKNDPFLLPADEVGGQLVQEQEGRKSEGEEALIMERPVRFPVFEEDVSSSIYKTATPTPKASRARSPSLPEFGILGFSQSSESATVNRSQSPDSAIADNPPPQPDTVNTFPLQTPRSPSPVPEILNPLDRPSSPDSHFYNPFADPYPGPESLTAEHKRADDDDIQSVALSRTAGREDDDIQSIALSRTAGLEDDDSSMSDWTEPFDNATDSDIATEDFDDAESDANDVVSDAESEASWARVRNNPSSSSSGRYGFN